jgi:GT2 family glycosyltransferase
MLYWKVCEVIGGFHPRLLPHYGSDYEFTIRAGRKGLVLTTTPDVSIVPDHASTGVRSAEQVPDIRTLFSKQYAMNPVCWTAFILLTSPIRWMPGNLARIWFGAFRTMQKRIIV